MSRLPKLGRVSDTTLTPHFLQFAYALEKVSVGSGIYSQGWRWIFIVEGLATLVAGFLAFFTLGEC